MSPHHKSSDLVSIAGKKRRGRTHPVNSYEGVKLQKAASDSGGTGGRLNPLLFPERKKKKEKGEVAIRGCASKKKEGLHLSHKSRMREKDSPVGKSRWSLCALGDRRRGKGGKRRSLIPRAARG